MITYKTIGKNSYHFLYGKGQLIFYITFGFVVVKAVPIGGVFMIFVLIAPTAIATLFTQKWVNRFVWSWVIGILGSIISIYISYDLNISHGSAIVTLLGVTVFVLAFVKVVMVKIRIRNQVS